jgi:hypothetical protein
MDTYTWTLLPNAPIIRELAEEEKLCGAVVLS